LAPNYRPQNEQSANGRKSAAEAARAKNFPMRRKPSSMRSMEVRRKVQITGRAEGFSGHKSDVSFFEQQRSKLSAGFASAFGPLPRRAETLGNA